MAATHFSGPIYVAGKKIIDENGLINVDVDLADILDANGNEMLEFDAVASAVNYFRFTNSATGNAVALSAQGDDTNVGLTLESKGTGAITLTPGSSGISLGGATAVTGAITGTSTSASALTVGANGATNPVLKIAANVASVATGISITGAAAASGVAVAAISSGTNENLTIDAKGSGTISLNATGTGNIVLGRAATGVSLAVTAGLTSSGPTGAGIGYATGAGGAVTQITSRTTGVTLSKLTGTITTNTSSLAAEGTADFIVTNTTVAIGDVVVVAIQSGSNSGGTIVSVSTVAAGSFTIRVHNGNVAAGTAETGAILINFAVIKAVSA